MIKAIFFDIDGTLVSFETHQILQSTIDSLKQLQENGIKIFVATGRGKDGLDVLNDITFDGYITLNGQYCFTKDQVIYKNYLPKEDLTILLDELKKKPFPCGFTLEETKIFNYRDERVDEIHSITHNDDHPAGDVSHIDEEEVLQLMAFISEEEEKELLSKMTHCHSARWHPLFCDITPIGGTKQKGIDLFLDYYGIDLSETMAFGDGGNDIEMLDHVNHPIVMGNGNDDVKPHGEYITDTVENDGVTKALKHYKLI